MHGVSTVAQMLFAMSSLQKCYHYAVATVTRGQRSLTMNREEKWAIREKWVSVVLKRIKDLLFDGKITQN